MGYIRRGWQGALEGLGEGIGNAGNNYLQHFFKQQDMEKESQLIQARQEAEMRPKIGELMLSHPEIADQLAKGFGHMDLSAFSPSDQTLTNPLLNKIQSASTAENVPGIDQILASVKGMGRPSMLTPSYGPTPGQGTPGLPLDPTNTSPDDSATPPLPSTAFGPVQNPTIQNLMAQRQARLGAIDTAHTQHLTDLQDEAKATHTGAGLGDTAPDVVAGDVAKTTALIPAEAARAGAITGASEDAKNILGRQVASARGAGLTAGAQARAELAPDIIAGKANEAGQARQAALSAEYNSPLTPKILNFDQQKATNAANAGENAAAQKERNKDLEDATTAAVNLQRQLTQLKPLYDKATQDHDPTAAKLYHDLVTQAAVNAGRASGYKGQFREYEFNAAQGLFPSLITDNVLGSSQAKWDALNHLVKVGPQVLKNVPVGADIDTYLKAVRDSMANDPLTADFNARKPGG